MGNKIAITPKTKVLDMIEAYPQLEEVLIKYVPAFEKLKNPVLRNTVARVASLKQAATMGNVPLSDLINHLRKSIGQDSIAEIDASGSYTHVRPEWFKEDAVCRELDIRPILNSGEHPVNQVLAELSELPAGGIYKLLAPFVPIPLIDKAASIGFKHWIHEGAEIVEVFFIENK